MKDDFNNLDNEQFQFSIEDPDFKWIVENSSNIIALIDSKFRYLFINSAGEQTIGISREEIIGKTNHELGMPSDNLIFFEKMVGSIFSTKKELKINFSFFAETDTRWYSTALIPQFDDKGAVKLVSAILCDITDLKKNSESLQINRDELEAKVTDNSHVLLEINKELEKELLDHKTAENTLRISEAKYRQLIDTMQEGIWVIDPAGKTTFVNPRMAQMLGYSASEMINEYIFSFMDEKMIPKAKEFLTRKSQGISEQFEFPYLRKDGTQVDFLLETSPMYDDQDNYIGALRCVMDISKLKESDAQLKATFEQKAVGIAHMAMDGHYLLVNQRFCEIVGYTEEELLRMRNQDVLEPSELSRLQFSIDQANAGESQFNSMERRYIRKDGKLIWVRGSIAILRDNAENPRLMIVLIEDITDQKEAEDTIEAQHEEIQAMFDKTIVGIVNTSLDGAILRINQRLCDIFGYSEEEIREFTFPSLNFPDDLDATREKIQQCIAGDITNFTLEKRFVRKDGTFFWASASSTLVRDTSSKPRFFSTFITDITDQVQNKLELSHKLEMEHVLSEISEKFTGIYQFDIIINESLQMLSEYFQITQSHIHILDPDSNLFVSNYDYYLNNKENPDQSIKNIKAIQFPWLFELLNAQKVVMIDDITHLPESAHIEIDLFESLETQAFLIIPINIQNHIPGFISFLNNDKREWNPNDLTIFQVFAAVVENAFIRKLAEDQLKEHELHLEGLVQQRTSELELLNEELELFVETIPDGILIAQPDGQIRLVNKTSNQIAEKILNAAFSPENNLLQPIDDNPLLNNLKKVFELSSEKQEEINLKFEALPNYWLELFAVAPKLDINDQPTAIIIEMRDITQFIEFDSMRKEFVTMVSHELKTPITNILLSIANYQKYRSKLSTEQREDILRIIETNSKLLSQVTEDLLIISGIEEQTIILKWDQIDFSAIITQTLEQLASSIRAKNLLFQTAMDSPCLSFGDENRLFQILRALIDTAIKMSKEHSTLQLNVLNNYHGEYNPEETEGVLIEFRNPKIDLNSLNINQFFERFPYCDEIKAIIGNQLGLNIAFRFIKIHMGKLFMHYDTDNGISIAIFLPRLENQPESAQING